MQNTILQNFSIIWHVIKLFAYTWLHNIQYTCIQTLAAMLKSVSFPKPSTFLTLRIIHV